jgi:hypothetical protein
VGTWGSKRRGSGRIWRSGAPHRRLLRLFSVVTLFAHSRMRQTAGAFRQAACYQKRHPTFADGLAMVREELWARATFCGSLPQSDTVKVPQALVERLTDAVCYAA